MKRDWDTIREILLEIEGLETDGVREYVSHRWSEDGSELLGGEPEKVAHAVLLNDAGFLELTRYAGGKVGVHNLTWEGYDLLDSIRNDSVWEKVKAKLASSEIASVPLEIMKGLAVSYLKQNLGL